MVRVSTAVLPLSCCLHLGVELLYSGVSPQLWATELSTFMDQRSLHSSASPSQCCFRQLTGDCAD